MKVLRITAAAAVFTLTLLAAGLSGTWKGSMETQMGQTEIVITLKSGAGVEGKVQAGEYEGPIQDGRVDGQKISFTASIAPGTLQFSGTVSGDEMKLDMTGVQGSKYKLTCKRQK